MILAKGRGIATFLVGHVTKEGAIAGPRVLEHLVDTVLYFEGEQHHAYRVLRAVKNRFGSTNEIGVFEMGERGLAEVPNPSGFFLAERPQGAPGLGDRGEPRGHPPPAPRAPGPGHPGRLRHPAAHRARRRLQSRMPAAGGAREARRASRCNPRTSSSTSPAGRGVSEPAADLGLVVAAASSYLDRPLRGDLVVVGEVGLAGEVRAVTGLERTAQGSGRAGLHRGGGAPEQSDGPGTPSAGRAGRGLGGRGREGPAGAVRTRCR